MFENWTEENPVSEDGTVWILDTYCYSMSNQNRNTCLVQFLGGQTNALFFLALTSQCFQIRWYILIQSRAEYRTSGLQIGQNFVRLLNVRLSDVRLVNLTASGFRTTFDNRTSEIQTIMSGFQTF